MKIPLLQPLGMLVEGIAGYKQMPRKTEIPSRDRRKYVTEDESGLGISAWIEKRFFEKASEGFLNAPRVALENLF